MKINRIVTTFCAAALLTTVAQAENAAANPQSGAQSSAQSNPQSQMNANLIDAAKLDGKQVKNLQGQDLGTVKQLLIDPQSGRIRFAVIQVDKAMNLESSEIAVPFHALQISGKPDDANFHLALDATKEKLQNAPKTKVGEADRLYTKESSGPIYDYWAIVWFDDNDANGSTASHQKGNGHPGTASSSSSAQPSNPSDQSGATSRSNSAGNVTTGSGSNSGSSGSNAGTSGNSGTTGSTTPRSSGSSTNNPSGATTETPK